MTNDQQIASLSQDHFRVGSAIQHRSMKVAEEFIKESKRGIEKIRADEVEVYISDILKKLPQILSQEDKQKLTEDVLKYSKILQDYAFQKINDDKK